MQKLEIIFDKLRNSFSILILFFKKYLESIVIKIIMKKITTICFAVLFCFSIHIFAQIPVPTLVQISKAEDELRFDKTLQNLMKSRDAAVRQRAALAAGRIGNDAAVPFLAELLANDKDANVRAISAFAIGEIESISGADAILQILKNTKESAEIRARAVEAAGKIAAANEKDSKAKNLSEAILDVLEFEYELGKNQNKNVVLLGITAVLRAKPEEANFILAKFLTNMDGRIRADAGNALARLRAKNADEKFRAMLLTDNDPIARANAARALGAAEDKESLNLLAEAALTDADSRVRVSAIRSLGSLKDAKSAEKLIERGRKLLADYKKSKFANPPEKNELLEIASVLGRILPNTGDEKAFDFLSEFGKSDGYVSPEIDVAVAQIAAKKYAEYRKSKGEISDWRVFNSTFAGLGELAKSSEIDKDERARNVSYILTYILNSLKKNEDEDKALANAVTAYAAYKTDTLPTDLEVILNHKDVVARAAAAQILGETQPTERSTQALQVAFSKALLMDKDSNDAQLAALSALVKMDKSRAIGQILTALTYDDYLLRRHAANLIRENDLQKDFPALENYEEKVGTLKSYNEKKDSKLGLILNSDADYKRAVSRKNGETKAILTTEKGVFTIDLLPEDAPLTIDNFIKLAKSGYFNGVSIHRVVANFVIQDGDPRGDGNGGPGWQIRDEINTVSYTRGTVGMALSGKNTGGSQWFVTHSPQPHLDGGYTVFGQVNEKDMKIVDLIVRGDKILKVEIVEGKISKDSKVKK